MKAVVFILASVLAACVGAAQPVYHPEVMQVVDSDSDKAVEIVSDERIAPHEPREVPATAVSSAMMASGQFLDDDAHTLAAPIARHLATMQPDESIRIVGWSEDGPRYYYVLVHDNKLQIIFYAGSTRANDYSAVIPAAATPIVAAAPPSPTSTEPSPSPVAPTVETAPVPPPKPTPASPRPHRPRVPPRPGFEPIGEAEARRRIAELDSAFHAGAITETEHRTKRKEVLARL